MRRLVAVIIDYVIIWIITLIISVFIALPALVQGVPLIPTTFDLLQGILFLFYAAFLESIWGSTLGKMFMNLRVTTTAGNPATLNRTLIRDLSKINQLLLLIDTLVGMATVGDPHQKLSDRFAGTTVVSTIQRSMILPTMQTSTPPPPSSP